ncbi:predicted protein [Streptomyces viridosporus ATCC 14672]|uniref:Predicted protein n=1 Tax=Streptomyces viridosporus (strain ATCC 14672 / DSM 40746 / JCM 4963 / KCTC 9882 / NRRL B-12104 / FH 1290) TaxID=566461 RepID=D6AA35_STRV1|nr:predicted protein [Streptomyces viridosporus ATCC 14672]
MDCRALHEAMDNATEERPMQVVLENHPALLANVIAGHHGIWVRPQVRLGDRYVSDFLIASRTSAGLRWHLVELESPTERLTNPGNQRESPTLRHAIDQIPGLARVAEGQPPARPGYAPGHHRGCTRAHHHGPGGRDGQRPRNPGSPFRERPD